MVAAFPTSPPAVLPDSSLSRPFPTLSKRHAAMSGPGRGGRPASPGVAERSVYDHGAMATRDIVRLHLLRHAHAGDPMRWHRDDSERPLSERGIRQAEAMGTFLAAAAFRPDVILASPKVRAAMTARLVAERVGTSVAIEPALAGPLDIVTLEHILAMARDPVRPLLVGHDPDFSELARELAGIGHLTLRKGALVRLDAERPLTSGSAVLRWLVPPELLGADTGSD